VQERAWTKGGGFKKDLAVGARLFVFFVLKEQNFNNTHILK